MPGAIFGEIKMKFFVISIIFRGKIEVRNIVFFQDGTGQISEAAGTQ